MLKFQKTLSLTWEVFPSKYTAKKGLHWASKMVMFPPAHKTSLEQGLESSTEHPASIWWPGDLIASELTHGQDHRYKLWVPEIPPEFSDVRLSTSSFFLNFILIIFYLN